MNLSTENNPNSEMTEVKFFNFSTLYLITKWAPRKNILKISLKNKETVKEFSILKTKKNLQPSDNTYLKR